MTSLVYDGVMDRFPGLKIIVGHGGGYLPYYACRHDDNFRRGFYRANDREFSTYLPKFYYDSVVFDPHMLEFLVHKVGAAQVLAGTDFPFCPASPADVVRQANISRKDQDAIIFGNAAKMFGIPH
jgi:aminocarboxymuconate-semialdehyde decarboxylase